MNTPQRDAILDEIGIPKVISIVQFTIDEAIDYVKKGFKDPLAEDDSYVAEGLVLKTPDGLLRKNGDRIIFKIKTCDFIKLKQKYGDNYNPKDHHKNINYTN